MQSAESLPDSWTLHSAITLDEDAPFAHISVGDFMLQRSEAMGSLDGQKNVPRVSTITDISCGMITVIEESYALSVVRAKLCGSFRMFSILF